MIVCVFIKGFVCTSVSLHGLIAHQRTAQVPVFCFTTFESILTQLPDWSVWSGGRWLLPVPNLSHCSLGHLQGCSAVSECFHRPGGLSLFFTLSAVRPSRKAGVSPDYQVDFSQGVETSPRQLREMVQG